MTQPNSLQPPRARSHWGGGDALVARLARRLGWQRRRVEAALWGPTSLFQQVARLIAALKAERAAPTLVAAMAPIDLATAAAQPEGWSLHLVTEQAHADAADDVALKIYNAVQNREHAVHALRRLRAARIQNERMELALCAKWPGLA